MCVKFLTMTVYVLDTETTRPNYLPPLAEDNETTKAIYIYVGLAGRSVTYVWAK